MKKSQKIFVLPMDNYANGEKLLDEFETIMLEPDMGDLVAYIKLNDGVHNFDYGGPQILLTLEKLQRNLGINFGIFLDLKIFDVSATLVNVMKKYLEIAPSILTVSASCSIKGITDLRRLLPDTKLAIVNVLTDISNGECMDRFGMMPGNKIGRDLKIIENLYSQKISSGDKPKPVDLIICSALDIATIKKHVGSDYGFVTPGIRDAWMRNPNEHQKRTTGVSEALELGADLIVSGAQLTKGCPENSISAAQSRQLTIEQIKNYYDKVGQN
ncbi:MAG: orotidine 5'-phosphate decarboxylase / HUMPS family protein [Candidatus Falkowbacteria bacterium]